MPDMPQAELDAIEQWYARTVTNPTIYRDNPPLVALAIIQRARDTRERRIVDVWTAWIYFEPCNYGAHSQFGERVCFS